MGGIACVHIMVRWVVELFSWKGYKIKAKLLLLNLIHLFAKEVLLVKKKLEIKETKTTWYSTFKTDKNGLSFFDFQLFHY